MKFPNFLVIGAQKSGTTSLYFDLQSHPQIWLPMKESSGLLDVTAGDTSSLDRYAKIFKDAPSGSLIGDLSTAYGRLERPIHLVEGARSAVGPQGKIVAILRNPLDRVASHYRHLLRSGEERDDLDDVLYRRGDLIGNSMYASILEPWFSTFGPDHVRVIRLESYAKHRRSSAQELFDWLGAGEWNLPDEDAVHNSAATRRVATGLPRRVVTSKAYRAHLHRYIPQSVRSGAQRLMLPRARVQEVKFTPAQERFLKDHLGPEVEKLAQLLGTEPWWSL